MIQGIGDEMAKGVVALLVAVVVVAVGCGAALTKGCEYVDRRIDVSVEVKP